MGDADDGRLNQLSGGVGLITCAALLFNRRAGLFGNIHEDVHGGNANSRRKPVNGDPGFHPCNRSRFLGKEPLGARSYGAARSSLLCFSGRDPSRKNRDG